MTREPVDSLGDPVASIGEPVDSIGEPVDSIGEPVASIGDPVDSIGEPVASIGEPVASIGDPVASIGEPVASIGDPVASIGEPVDSIGDPAHSIDEPTRLARAVACVSPARLGRAVACVSPARLGQRSRAHDLLAEVPAELLSLAPRAALALFVAMVVSALMFDPRMRVFVESKADIAKATVKKYAFEAYPSWRAQHANAVCPDDLQDLNAYMNNKTVRDEWDGVYEMSCSEYGILVWTAGEDGRAGTRDDIRSAQ